MYYYVMFTDSGEKELKRFKRVLRAPPKGYKFIKNVSLTYYLYHKF